MNLRLKVSKVNFLFFICLLYILMRVFITHYVTGFYKYAFILIFSFAFLLAILKKRNLKEIGSVQITLVISWMLYVVLSAWFGGGTELLSIAFEKYLFYMLPIFIVPLIADRINWHSIFKFLVYFGIVDAIVSLYEFITHNRVFSANSAGTIRKELGGYTVIRTYGINGSYFLLAEILCICGLSALFLYKFYKWKIGLWGFIIISAGVFSTGSRGYYVAYLVGVFYIFWKSGYLEKLSGKQLTKLIAIILVIALGLYLLLGTNITFNIAAIDTILVRFRQIFDWSGETANLQRIQHWKYAVEKWKEHLFIGSGACCTDPRYSGYEMVTESGVLKRLVEFGIIGTILQYSTMFYPLIKGNKKDRETGNDDVDKILFLAIIITFFVEDMVLQRYSELEFTIVIWTCIAYCAYARKHSKMIQ